MDASVDQPDTISPLKPTICATSCIKIFLCIPPPQHTFHLIERLVGDVLLAVLLLLLPPSLQLLVRRDDDHAAPRHLFEGARLAQLSILVHVRLDR